MDPESAPERLPEHIQLPLVWVAAEEEPIQLANQFLVQFDKDTLFLSVGQTAPPAILGTPEEQFEQLKALSFVAVKTIGRFSLTRRNVAELIDVLTKVATAFDTKPEETG